MTILALQLASPIIRAIDIGGADSPRPLRLKSAGRTKRAAPVYSPESRCWRRRSSSGSTYFVRHLRADAVGELCLGVPLDVALDLLPVVLVVAHLLAVGADRQEPLEQLHAGRARPRSSFTPVGEGRLEPEQSFADADPRVQLFPLKGLTM